MREKSHEDTHSPIAFQTSHTAAAAPAMLLLSNRDAEQLLTMSDCIGALESAYREFALGRAANAARSDAVTLTERPDAVAFCQEMHQATGVAVVAAPSPASAVKDADIVLCASNAAQHVFQAQWLQPGMHVSTIRGAELEPAVITRSQVIAVNDRVAHANISVTAGVTLPKHRHSIAGMDPTACPTLADLIAGFAPARTTPEQISCFVNLPGTGLQFAAVGAALYQKARAAGRGHELSTEWFTEDVVP